MNRIFFFGVVAFIGLIVAVTNLLPHAITVKPISKEFRTNVQNHFVTNPPPPRKSSVNPSNKLYIMILDTEFGPSRVQCIQKEVWIDEVSALDFVDGVELYSNVSFKNKNCSVTSLSFPTPNFTFPLYRDSTCYTFMTALGLYLERSDAEWLLVTADHSFVNVDQLRQLREELVEVNYKEMKGHTIGARDYFEHYAPASGGLFSRTLIKELMNTQRIFPIACKAEISAFEAFAHATDPLEMYAIQHNDPRWLGLPFQKDSFDKWLFKHDFSNLPKCPGSYESFRVPHPTINEFKNVVVWGGSEPGLFRFSRKREDKIAFLSSARSFIKNIPPDIRFLFDVYRVKLCSAKA